MEGEVGVAQDGPRAPNVLRFAVAMRGGVSLAVWIGGAFYEIDRIRRGEDAFSEKLLAVTSFRSVEVDILTGASAGGLNAAIGGLAISRGVAPELRNTWIETANIDKLLADRPRTSDPKQRRSILNGDYFLQEVSARLSKTVATGLGGATGGRPSPVQVFLAATVFGGVKVVERSDRQFADKRHEAYFHYRHLARHPAFSDLVHPDAESSLGLAARSTASFPGAFEPEALEPADFVGRLHLPATQATPPLVHLYDGGVVDNIPVTRAIRASAAAPATETIRRWVLFLHPSPTAAAEPASGAEDESVIPPVTKVVSDVISTKTTESLLDDLDVLRQYNRDAESQAMQRYSACEAVLTRERDPTANDAADDESIDGLLASVDADWLYSLLDDPAASSLPWIPIRTDAQRSPLDGLADDQRYQKRMGLLNALLARKTTIRPFARVARLAHLTIDWIRWVEGRTRADLAGARQTAYDVLQTAELVESALCLAFLKAAPLDSIVRLGEVLTEMESSSRLHALVNLVGSDCGKPRGTPLAERLSGGPLDAFVTLAKGGIPTAGPAIGKTSASQRLVDRLAEIGSELRSRTKEGASARDPSIFRLFCQILDAEPSPETVARILKQVDGACAGLHRGRVVGTPRTLDYIRVSGARPSPLADAAFAVGHLPKLQKIAVGPSGMIDPKLKLAGGTLGNFSAFLSRRFRANDWMWGRMDAASGLVEVMLRPTYLSTERAGLAERFGDLVQAPFPATGSTPPALIESARLVCEDLWTTYREQVCIALVAQPQGAEPGDPDDGLQLVRALVTTRWHLELFIEDVGGVLDEPLDGGHGDALPAMCMPTDAIQARHNLQLAMKAYDDLPRHASDLWGRRRSTALGVRVARHVAEATVPGPLKVAAAAPLMFVVDAVLLRGAFLVSWALLVNLVLVPRLTVPARVGVVIASGAAGAVFWRGCVKRERGNWRAWLTGILAAGATGFGVATWWVGSTPFAQPKPQVTSSPGAVLLSHDHQLWWAVITVAVATFAATSLLWLWAKWGWQLLLATVAGLTLGWWEVVGAWRPGVRVGAHGGWRNAHVDGPLRVLAMFGSMWVGVILLVVLATFLALRFDPEDRESGEPTEAGGG